VSARPALLSSDVQGMLLSFDSSRWLSLVTPSSALASGSSVGGVLVEMNTFHLSQTRVAFTGCSFVDVVSGVQLDLVSELHRSLVDGMEWSVDGCTFERVATAMELSTLWPQSSGVRVAITNSRFLGGMWPVSVVLFSNESSHDFRLTVAGSVFANNSALDRQAGIFLCVAGALTRGAISITDTVFSNNTINQTGSGFGAAVALGYSDMLFNTSVSIDGCTFVGNVAPDGGGAISVFPLSVSNESMSASQPPAYEPSVIRVTNTAFLSNSAPRGSGGALMVAPSSVSVPHALSVEFDNVSFVNNSASV
jgi:hypothetical protein